jgi:DNA-binding CsgD family transcriptional regulator
MSSSAVKRADLRRGHGVLPLEREAELSTFADALDAAIDRRGSLLLVDGPAGIGKTTLLRAACAEARGRDARIVTARGLALEGDFPYGVVRQLFEPVRSVATESDWSELIDGAAGLAERVFGSAGVASVEDDVPYATLHGLFWLAANLAARRPLVVAVDDAHWADPPSLRWLTHLANRLDGLRILLLLAIRTGPDVRAGAMLDELRAAAEDPPLRPQPLSAAATALLVRDRLGHDAGPELCSACHARTAGNPFLLDAVMRALHAERTPLSDEAVSRVAKLGPEPVARAVLRRVAQLPRGAEALIRAVAVLGGPASLRQAAGLAGQDVEGAMRLADQLRAAAVLTHGTALEFAHPIVRSAIYDAIDPGERALGHARAAELVEQDGADPERVALHLLRSEPAARAQAVARLRAAAESASGRGAPDAAATYLRRALEEPPAPVTRPAVLLELGLALAADRQAAAPDVLREAVQLTPVPGERAERAALSARALGLWGHHDSVIVICREALAGGDALERAQIDRLEAELTASAWVSPATVAEARRCTRGHRDRPGSSSDWRINAAFADTVAGLPGHEAMRRLVPVLADGSVAVAPDSLTAVFLLLVLVFNDELVAARAACDAALDAARRRGSMSMVAHASCIRSIIARRSGQLEDAVSDGRLALDFKLATSPALAVAWAAAFLIEPLVDLGRLDDADAVADQAGQRDPTPGYIHTLLFLQARGALRCAQERYDDALRDLLQAGTGWRQLGCRQPALATWRTDAAAAHSACGQQTQAARLAAEQLAAARRVGTPRTLAIALRTSAATTGDDQAEQLLSQAVRLLEPTPARLELARALTDLGALQRRTGRRKQARAPLLRALELADRAGATPLAGRARGELLAAGARPRRTALTGPDALTSAERRVAEHASQGLTNRQIAQRLFITQPTVETHLRHIFQKLDIASRTELPDRLR